MERNIDVGSKLRTNPRELDKIVLMKNCYLVLDFLSPRSMSRTNHGGYDGAWLTAEIPRVASRGDKVYDQDPLLHFCLLICVKFLIKSLYVNINKI